MKISEFSVKNYQFTIILFIMVLVLGLNSLFNMPRGEDPPFNAPIFVITAVYPGTSPSDMEELLADPIEEAMYELEDVKKITTNCDEGVMLMQIYFNFSVNTLEKFNDVNRELNRLRPELPEDLLSLDLIRAQSSDVEIFQLALVSQNASFSELKSAAEALKSDLEKIRELKQVRIQACPERQISVELDLEKMARNNLGINEVLAQLQAGNVNIPGGSIDLGSRKFSINTTSSFENIDDIRNLVIRTTPEGRLVFLRDVASVRFDDAENNHRARYNGQQAVWVNIRQKDKKNIVQVSEQIYPVLEKFRLSLPENISLVNAFDQAQGVKKRLAGLGKDFLFAVLLVLLTLLPLGWRASLVVMISIPLSLAIGVALLEITGFTLNQLSIVGLVVSLGLLVDDSIVIVENIERFRRLGYSSAEAAIAGTKQIGIAVIGCTATLILAFLPLAFLPEASGDFIRSLPMAVILTILASLFVALTIIPFLSRLLLKKEEQSEGNFFLRIFRRYLNEPYQQILKWSFRHPVLTLVSAFGLFAASLLLVPLLGFSLFPISEKPMFLIDVETPLGSSLDRVDSVVAFAEARLMDDERLVSVSSNIGRGNPRVYYNEFQRQYSSNYGQLFVQVRPDMTASEITAFADELRAVFSNYPGARITVKQFQQGPPIVAPVEIRITGEHLDTLRRLAAEVEQMITSTPGTINVNNDLSTQKTDIQVVVNKEKAGLLGIPLAAVARTVRLGIAGLEAGEYRDDTGESYVIFVGLAKKADEALETFSQIYLTSLSGASVPLSQIASIELKNSPPVIRHFNKERYASVSAYVRTGYNTAAVTDAIIGQLEARNFPAGYSFVPAGERETQEESFGGMATIIIIASFGLLAILVLEFRTFKSTLIVLSVVPLGIIGALATLYLVGETLSFVATVGMIALVGIEIKNSIFLVDYTNQLREQGMPLEQAILEGAETRFLPIFLTSLTAIGGLIPLILLDSPLISPLAWVICGGLVSSLLLSRIVTPLLYKLLPPSVGER
ncbi:MAG: hypothetical protein RI973_1265 [Bacteroidota bacterium]|jgi:multidrug efflux pump subunit AcrB